VVVKSRIKKNIDKDKYYYGDLVALPRFVRILVIQYALIRNSYPAWIA